MLEVADTGEGILPGLIGKVFELFVQGDRSLDRGKGGLGIGLALVKALTTLHGGRVSARSEGAGQGSVFTVRLPSIAAPQVYEAAAGQTGVASAKDADRHIVLIDVRLPGLDGYEVARRIRSTKRGVHVAHDEARTTACLRRGRRRARPDPVRDPACLGRRPWLVPAARRVLPLRHEPLGPARGERRPDRYRLRCHLGHARVSRVPPRRDVPFHWIVLAFGLFIVVCGMTHFMELWTLWSARGDAGAGRRRQGAARAAEPPLNAFKFTPAGGSIRCRLDGEGTVTVEDSGPGIAPAMRQAVFDRFRQGDEGPTRRFGGTGLGLAIARDFVELHGGSIEIDASPPGGARFTVRLPLAAPAGALVEVAPRFTGQPDLAEQVLADARAQTPGSRGTERAIGTVSPPDAPERPVVLVAEDNVEMNRFLVRMLQPTYDVVPVFNGAEALARLAEVKPGLVLTDVMMPEMSGDELVRRVRQRPELDTMPIMLLTAKADDTLRAHLLREGAQDYVTKPFAEDEVRARVANLPPE